MRGNLRYIHFSRKNIWKVILVGAKKIEFINLILVRDTTLAPCRRFFIRAATVGIGQGTCRTARFYCAISTQGIYLHINIVKQESVCQRRIHYRWSASRGQVPSRLYLLKYKQGEKEHDKEYIFVLHNISPYRLTPCTETRQ